MSNPNQDSGIPVLTEVILTLPPRQAEPAVWIPTSHDVPAPAPAAQFNVSSNQTFAQGPPFFTAPTTPAVYLADIPVLQVEIETPPAPIEHAPITGWLDEEWTRMEQKISERVLTQLMSRIDSMLEQRMQEVLSTSLQRAADEIKHGLQQTLSEVVSDAVSQEINELHCSKNRKY